MLARAAAFALLLGLGMASDAHAADMRVAPTRLFFAPDERVKDVLIGNPGQQALLVELQAFHWGDAERRVAKEIVLSPPIVKIAPQDSAVVRVGFRKQAASGCESTYRLWLTEVPVAREGTDEPVQMRTRMDLPVFRYHQAGCQAQLHARVNRAQQQLVVTNSGNAHVLLQRMHLRAGKTRTPIAITSLAYVLPGGQRSFVLPRNAEQQSLSRAEVVVETPRKTFTLPLEYQP